VNLDDWREFKSMRRKYREARDRGDGREAHRISTEYEESKRAGSELDRLRHQNLELSQTNEELEAELRRAKDRLRMEARSE
jgi:hypothetical protein